MLNMKRGVFGTVIASVVAASPAIAQTFTSEREIGSIRLGQKVLVDDGTCPAGQVKEVSGTRLVADGVQVERQCVQKKVRR